MAINYTWDCKTVDVKTIDGNEDTVFNVHWQLKGTDEDLVADILTDKSIDSLKNVNVKARKVK